MPTLAAQIGLNEAIILQQIHYWLQSSTHRHDDQTWIYNTYSDWQDQFPFWSVSTIKRAILNLEKKGLVISGNYNKMKIDKTKWYRIDYAVLDDLEQAVDDHRVKLTHREDHDDPSNSSICHDQLPETTTETTTEKKTPNGVSAAQKSTTKVQSKAKPPIKGKLAELQPKKAIQARFLELTGLSMPKAKKSCGFWWSQFAEILHAATGDEQRAIQAMGTVIPYMRESNLSITGPQSVLGLCRSVLSGQKLGKAANEPSKRNPTQSFESIQSAARERLARSRNAA